MPISRTGQPRHVKEMYETLHIHLNDEETACGLMMQPLLRVTGAFAEDFWVGEYERPVADACHRCAAGMRWLAREFNRELEMREELRRRGEWPP